MNPKNDFGAIQLDGHCSVLGDCPKTVIDCEYKDIGCQFKVGTGDEITKFLFCTLCL